MQKVYNPFLPRKFENRLQNCTPQKTTSTKAIANSFSEALRVLFHLDKLMFAEEKLSKNIYVKQNPLLCSVTFVHMLNGFPELEISLPSVTTPWLYNK